MSNAVLTFEEKAQMLKDAGFAPFFDENIYDEIDGDNLNIPEDDFISELSALKTWEDITSKQLLVKILCNFGKTEKEYAVSALRTKAKELRRAAEFNRLIKVLQNEINEAVREKYLEDNPNGLYFTDCPIILNCNDYRGDDSGIYLYDACIIPQPLVITKKIVDIEGGNVRVELALRIKNKWEYITVDREIIASRLKIVSLANHGVMVTTENAVAAVNYLQYLQVENTEEIPVAESVSHMGYIKGRDKKDYFVPYSENLIYSGDTAYADIYNAVYSKGSVDEWAEFVKSVRNDSLAARAVIAASFASPLISKLNKLNFFTHIWGNSDTGKSVALRLAASVWGNPDEYMKNLNTTGVGFERNAYFFHNMPFILDELQTVKNDKLSQLIYSGTQGQGRMRGTAYGVEKLLKWKLGFLTAGEQPLTKTNSGTGEINRIIDVYVKGAVFKNPSYVYAMAGKNYGYAGKSFIENLNGYDLDEMIQKWETFVQSESEKTSGKQRMSASLLLCADELVNCMFLGYTPAEAKNTTVEFWEKLSETLADAKESDYVNRAYDFIVGWVAENRIKFTDDTPNERWGRFNGKTQVFISGNALESALHKAEFNYRAVLKGFAERKYLISSDNPNNTKNTKAFWINGTVVRGIELKINMIENDEDEFYIKKNPYQTSETKKIRCH